MNDIVHSSLKINLIVTELMKRIVHTEQLVNDYRTEADNLKEQYEGLQLEKEVLDEEKEELKAEIEQWEKDYEALEDKSTLDVSWAFLNTRLEILMEASQEDFDLNAEIAKDKETIKKTQQSQNFSSPEVGVPEGDELTPSEVGVQASSAQVESSPAADDAILDSASPTADSVSLNFAP
ncbi:GRIP domain-containing protein RUD3-like [Nicotiana tomentosiformis]|uniref:GRIP domain-containing protein RUD3-like n=1 Tax=Nicotiana tomentosiformis TaxID=4098 RepID=UPI00051C49E3|nr:uncharacterized protein LOC104110613 [Nicotiana tomentosiformis]